MCLYRGNVVRAFRRISVVPLRGERILRRRFFAEMES